MAALSPPDRAAGAGPSAQALAGAADSLACALLMLAADGTLLHANQAGLAFLRRGHWLQLETLPDRQRVAALGTTAARSFQRALAAAAAGVRQDLTLPAALRPARAVIKPLPPSSAVAVTPLLLMLSAGAGEDGAPVDLSGYAERHALSPAETRVLTRLARGDSAAVAARALGLGVSTVRTQIASLRRKTGHLSQAALGLDLALLPPLRPLATPAAR